MYFPVVFSLKVIGTVEANLEPFILSVLDKNKIDTTHARISVRLSGKGKYTAFTATFMAKSREQLDNIYSELSGDPRVIMVL